MQIDLTQYPDTLAAFGGDEQRATVFLDRYSQKDGNGVPVEYEPIEMWERVARSIGGDEYQRGRFYDLLSDFKFVPGGRILAGAGVDADVTYYNCYVIPVETKARRQNRFEDEHTGVTAMLPRHDDRGSDSREAIFDTIGLMVDIMSRGGGVGINWSVLRPKGTHLKSVNGTTSGPVSWMDVASRAVGVVEQGGSRRGAAMFMIDDWHPDVEEFINAKRDFALITNANVSVAVSDEFMEAVQSGGSWQLRFPDPTDPQYNTKWNGDLAGWERDGGRVIVHRTVDARSLWRNLAHSAWASGEPGVVFLGRYNALSTGKGVERIISVNPCGEQGLGAYSVCNLGAMNLAAYIIKPKGHSKNEFNFSALGADSAVALEFLDRVIDTTSYFIPENEAIQKKLRRVGLGVMGLADVLIMLGIRYGSPEAVKFTEEVFWTIRQAAMSRSAFLAEKFGAAPGWNKDIPYSAKYIQEMAGSEFLWGQITKTGLRNMFLLTQAPTGTTSILAGVNSGIEPLFALTYTRKDRTGTHKVVAPVLAKIGVSVEDAERWSKFTSNKHGYVVTANEVSVEQHIAMQAAAQKHIDSSVSKTINAPNDQTVDEVEKAFTLAYESGLKGVAYFRDGSGRDQVLYREEPKTEPKDSFRHIDWCPSTGPYGSADCECPETDREYKLQERVQELEEHLHELSPYLYEVERPEALVGSTHKVSTKNGTAYVTVNFDNDNRPIEVFVNVGKSGDDTMALGEALGRLASLALRKGASLEGVAHQLLGIGGFTKIAFAKSIPHAVGEVLDKESKGRTGFEDQAFMFDEEGEATPVEIPHVIVGGGWSVGGEADVKAQGEQCPSCGELTAQRVEGCMTCYACGWSAC